MPLGQAALHGELFSAKIGFLFDQEPVLKCSVLCLESGMIASGSKHLFFRQSEVSISVRFSQDDNSLICELNRLQVRFPLGGNTFLDCSEQVIETDPTGDPAISSQHCGVDYAPEADGFADCQGVYNR